MLLIFHCSEREQITFTLLKNIFTDSLDFNQSQKLPLKSLKLLTLWNQYLNYRFVHTSALCCFWRENSPERGIQSVSEWRKHRHFSDDSSEHLWLAIAFKSSTESCVIGYNAQHCKNASISGSASASDHRSEFSSWWYDLLNELAPGWLYYN